MPRKSRLPGSQPLTRTLTRFASSNETTSISDAGHRRAPRDLPHLVAERLVEVAGQPVAHPRADDDQVDPLRLVDRQERPLESPGDPQQRHDRRDADRQAERPSGRSGAPRRSRFRAIRVENRMVAMISRLRSPGSVLKGPARPSGSRRPPDHLVLAVGRTRRPIAAMSRSGAARPGR